jgi:hypothetical protein
MGFREEIAELPSCIGVFFRKTKVLQCNDSFEIIRRCSSDVDGLPHCDRVRESVQIVFLLMKRRTAIFYIEIRVFFHSGMRS